MQSIRRLGREREYQLAAPMPAPLVRREATGAVVHACYRLFSLSSSRGSAVAATVYATSRGLRSKPVLNLMCDSFS